MFLLKNCSLWPFLARILQKSTLQSLPLSLISKYRFDKCQGLKKTMKMHDCIFK